MRQIPEDKLLSILKNIKEDQEFQLFVAEIQKKFDRFLLKKKFTRKGTPYPLQSSEGEASPELKKFLKILKVIEELKIEGLIFLSHADLEEKIKTYRDLELDTKNSLELIYSKKLQELLEYKTLRSGGKKLLYTFYKKLGIKSCIYCNSQHTVILKNKTMRLQADHRYPQSKFPMFSITLANLYPTCNNCNHQKGDDELNYSLYRRNDEFRDIGFRVCFESIVNYCTKRNTNNAEELLEISFKDYMGNDLNPPSKLNEILKIEEIYENHKDIVANLINTQIMYKKTYLDSLGETFGAIFQRGDKSTNRHLFNQMLYGNTLDENDINKNVFSKLKVDIKKQLDKLNLEKYVENDGFG